ncbi:HNH endonuclease [Actinomyces urogenitalis]|uniref:HNH endonuclease n=1 Tax=Actinomyces urogenitalis TaxID=103621 RepID=UPI00242CFA89|nr:HNH endonuclease signature motif containing protein [Actinomyces urogenitalis]MBS5978045.1 HNH endonuclease [Actinomyces urogenitalis]MDU0865326.1 HNH endonuclease signature motif containing protein [Actinomyces urogenitalis]MDU0875781.1 HNH endonuclease signature motif containing protein [Actinomyces urogenitalis]MDU1565492.1 HNH endonuclease signature motif containing protein [Actinomyces urogenitalis]MDU1640866.1 HNH endonuclease signature motif containing protein [Actinomyces urogenital
MTWGGSRVRRLRSQVITAWGTTCWLCGGEIDLSLPRREPGGFTIDHVVPRSKGGGDDVANLRPAHHHCNTSRQDRAPTAMRLRRQTAVASGWPGLTD